jgi:hypothetical protein
MPTKTGNTYYDILTNAINDIAENGYDSPERVAYWVQQLKKAAERTMASDAQMQAMLREALAQIYRRMVERGEIAKFHAGVGRFTIEKLRPQLRAELDRRIVASAELIKLNRSAAIEKTMQRFTGWATSVPKGGSEAVNKRDEKQEIRKPTAQLKFQERRVLIDQGHKLVANINEIIATDGGAIAVIWHSHWRQANYDYREDHKERDGHTFMIRNNWAQKEGLVRVGPDGYYDEITSVGEEPFCRCYATYIYALRDLPRNLLTKKGEAALDAARAKVRELMNG